MKYTCLVNGIAGQVGGGSRAKRWFPRNKVVSGGDGSQAEKSPQCLDSRDSSKRLCKRLRHAEPSTDPRVTLKCRQGAAETSFCALPAPRLWSNWG